MWHPFLGTPQQLSPSTTLGRLSADKLAVELFTADLAAAPGAAWIHQGKMGMPGIHQGIAESHEN